MKAHRSSTSSSESSGSEQYGRRALRACLWAVLLVIALDIAGSQLMPEGFLLESEDLTRQRAETQPAPDIQIVGDSVVRSGMMGSALSDGQLTVRNDGMAASGPPKTYLLLQRQFEMGHVPRLLVIAHSPHTFGRVRFEELVGGFAHWNEIPGLVQTSDEKWTEALYGVLTRFSYLLRHRTQFRQSLTEQTTSPFKQKETNLFVEPDAARLAEYVAVTDKAITFGEHLPAHAPTFYGNAFGVTRTNDIYFRRILALARQHHVTVVWITMPVPEQVKQARARTRHDEQFMEYLQQFEKTGEMKILSDVVPAYPDQYFTDWLHLNLMGAVRFACELETLKPWLAIGSQGRAAAHNAGMTPGASDTFSTQLAPYCAGDGDSADMVTVLRGRR